jgi:uncharacterized protein (DUF305 family)
MTPRTLRRAAAPLAAAALLLLASSPAATAQTPVQPGAPGEESRTMEAGEAAALTRPGHTPADVAFMRDMIHHHAQAVEMTALVPDRASRAEVHSLARRIESSQADEIAMMTRWLQDRGEAAPTMDNGDDHHAHDHHAHDHHDHGAPSHAAHAAHADGLMPGMLSDEQMARLAAASGEEFDRLFLEYMIFHHEGALVMVDELLAAEGAAQETEIFQFASHVDSDQRAEIDRMRRLLESIPSPR